MIHLEGEFFRREILLGSPQFPEVGHEQLVLVIGDKKAAGVFPATRAARAQPGAAVVEFFAHP